MDQRSVFGKNFVYSTVPRERGYVLIYSFPPAASGCNVAEGGMGGGWQSCITLYFLTTYSASPFYC